MVLVRGGITVKPHVQRAADILVAEFGASLSPGTYNGHSPPEGPTQALDLFTPVSAAGWALQGRIADFLIANAKRFGVRYVIKWNPDGADWIWNIERAREGWRAMATRDHRDHVHVTFYATAPENPTEPPAPPPVLPKELRNMDFTYIADGGQGEWEDFVFLPSVRYHGRLPYADALETLKKAGLMKGLGKQSREFHDGMIMLSDNAGFTGDRSKRKPA